MKKYETEAPEFSESLDIFETTDPAHADLFNQVNKKVFENTLHLRNSVKELGEKSAVTLSNTAPEDTNGLWADTSNSGGAILKYYDVKSESWVAMKATWG